MQAIFAPLAHSRKVLLLLLAFLFVLVALWRFLPWPPAQPQAAMSRFVASIDTMKESKDTDSSGQLTDAQIAADINLCASLNTTHITVDTHYDADTYMARWVQAIRKTGKHVWFRPGFAGWGTRAHGLITPTTYLKNLRAFILSHSGLFQPGDIFDANAEPENGRYWGATYGSAWSHQGPNKGTDDYNAFLVGLTETADQAFQQLGIKGVLTTVHSTNPWIAEHPEILYPSTVERMGNLITVDAYPDEKTTDPAVAANAWMRQLMRIHTARPAARIFIGEMGYSNKLPVDDQTQAAVLKEELDALSSVSYLAGINYWVGAGSASSGGYTYIFTGSAGHWSPRPAAYVLAAFYRRVVGF